MLQTSTKPVLVETDVGTALVKYMGNPQGMDALISEKLAADFARELGLPVPDNALLDLSADDIEFAGASADDGPAFISRWLSPAATFSPNSKLLHELRDQSFVSRLVVFDTWIKNSDRFVPTPGGNAPNYDNLLFVPDKKKVAAYLIDHSHAFVETTFEDEIADDTWWQDENVFGLFPNFATLLNHDIVMGQIDRINKFCDDGLEAAIASVPPQWHMTTKVRDAAFSNLKARANHLASWLPVAIFEQNEMNYEE